MDAAIVAARVAARGERGWGENGLSFSEAELARHGNRKHREAHKRIDDLTDNMEIKRLLAA